MRNAKFKAVRANYRKRAFDIAMREGKKDSHYCLPFALFRDHKIGTANRVTDVTIDSKLGGQGVIIRFQDGSKIDFPSDFVLYYCDPSYNWSPLNQLKKALKEKLHSSRISVRVLADALHTSPSQVVRLFDENKASKQLLQLFQMAELAGYKIEFQLKRKGAA